MKIDENDHKKNKHENNEVIKNKRDHRIYVVQPTICRPSSTDKAISMCSSINPRHKYTSKLDYKNLSLKSSPYFSLSTLKHEL